MDNVPDRFEHEGRTVIAFRPCAKIRIMGKPIPPGNWVVEDKGVTFDMGHELFMATYGISAARAGIPVGRSVGFGTPDDPRNFENKLKHG